MLADERDAAADAALTSSPMELKYTGRNQQGNESLFFRGRNESSNQTSAERMNTNRMA